MPRPISEFVTALEKLPAALDMAELKAAALEAAEVIRADMASRAPVDTGRLSRGITKKFQSDSTHASLSVDIGPDKAGWYGRFQDKGTQRMRANPFIDPAFRAQGPIAGFLLGESIQRIILRIFNK